MKQLPVKLRIDGVPRVTCRHPWSQGLVQDIQVNEASTNEETKLEPYDNTIEDNVQNEAGNRNKRKTLINRLLPSAVCPQQSLPLYLFTAAILLLLLWGVLYTLFKDLVAPRGPLFQMLFLFILAYLAGQFTSLCRLPPLLGMLVTGIALRNVGFFHMTGIFVDLVSTLRNTAMVVILIKAGLGLDAGALRRLSLIVVRLAFIPCLAEAATVCLVSHFLLGYSWLWGLLLGFILGAVSPAVVVPSLLTLKEKGYGEDKGISTLVVAASSIDDIAAISGFGIVLSVIFSQGKIVNDI
uniref:Cation/H+ exchanger transmembrane domain-containing protein n=1 Tax=Timema tahoe TaxID=61484 RepID=A0A7R9FHJ1_9NEOP|nr:unnamed protein product [Timema tahoe]